MHRLLHLSHKNLYTIATAHSVYMDREWAFVCPPVHESTCEGVVPEMRGQGRAGTICTECYRPGKQTFAMLES